MSNITKQDDVLTLEQVVINGDLSKLGTADRVIYYKKVCESLGLNPLTKPFDYINLNGKLTLYARRDAADQLRKIHGISINIISRDRTEDLYIVTARAKDREGREDESVGVINISGCRGESLANAMMKAETKAKRRVTLSIAGLGWLDETELEDQPIIPVTTNSNIEVLPNNEQKATEPQQKMIYAKAKANGMDANTVNTELKKRFNASNASELTKRQASEVIEMLGKAQEQTAATKGE